MAHQTGTQCIAGKEGQYVCQVRGTYKCIDQKARSCEGEYETCTFEEHGYGVAGLIFPPLRCPSCRRERKGLTTSTHKCSICGRMFIVRAGSKRFWKTHGLADPSEYIIKGPYGPECGRCRDLDDIEKEKRRKLFEFHKQGILSQKRMEQLVRSRNPQLLQKVREERLRAVDVADIVIHYDVRGNKTYGYRKPGRTEVKDSNGNPLFTIYHKGNHATLVNPWGKVVGYTFWHVPILGEPHYVTYRPDLSSVTSYTFERSDHNLTIGPDYKEKGKTYAGRQSLLEGVQRI